MANTRTVTGTILQPDGTAYTEWAVRFYLLREIISDGDAIPKQKIEVTTAINGTFTITLAVPDSGTASYKLEFPTGYSQEFYLAAGSSIGLNEILSIPTVSADPNYITELTSLKITYTAVDLQITPAHEYVWSDGTVTITLPATTGKGDVYFVSNQGSGTITVAVTGSDTINGTTPLTIPANTIAYYVDAEIGNWHSNW
jgi:hypothetical protein